MDYKNVAHKYPLETIIKATIYLNVSDTAENHAFDTDLIDRYVDKAYELWLLDSYNNKVIYLSPLELGDAIDEVLWDYLNKEGNVDIYNVEENVSEYLRKLREQ